MDSNHEALNPLLIPVKEACRILNLGNTTIYKLINQKKLEVVKFGKATRITVKSINALANYEAA